MVYRCWLLCPSNAETLQLYITAAIESVTHLLVINKTMQSGCENFYEFMKVSKWFWRRYAILSPCLRTVLTASATGV